MKCLLVIALVFLLASLAHATPFAIVDQYPNGAQHDGANSAIAKTNVLSNTNALIALVAINSSLALTPSDDNGGTWSKCPASTVFNSAGNPVGIAAFYSLNHPTGWTTVTISLGGTDNESIDLIQASGVTGLDVCGAGNNNSNVAGTAVSTGNVVTTYNNDLIVCAAGLGANNAGTTSTAGYTALAGAQSEGVAVLIGAYKTVTSTGTYNCAWTANSSNAWAGLAMSFKMQSAVAAAAGTSVMTSAVQSTPASSGCLHYPRGFGCGQNVPLNSNYRTYLATAGDNTSALNTELALGKDELIGPVNAVIQILTDVTVPANTNIQCMPGVVIDMSAATSSSFHGWSITHQANGDGGSTSGCTFRGHNYNINPPGILNSGNNGPWLMMDNGSSIVNYTITDNYFNGPGGQCGIELANGPPGSKNVVITYNTFDQSELYGLCTVGSTGGFYAHNWSTASAMGNENNSNANAYANEVFFDNEMHFGVGNGYYNAASLPSDNLKCIATYFQLCGSDSGTMDGSTGLAINNIIDGDGNCMDIFYSNQCDPGPTVYGNILRNGAQVHGGSNQPSCFNGIGC